MSKDTRLLQAILSEQALMRKEMRSGFEKVNKKVDKNGKRIDKIGSQLAYLEDDAPTREEFDNLLHTLSVQK